MRGFTGFISAVLRFLFPGKKFENWSIANKGVCIGVWLGILTLIGSIVGSLLLPSQPVESIRYEILSGPGSANAIGEGATATVNNYGTKRRELAEEAKGIILSQLAPVNGMEVEGFFKIHNDMADSDAARFADVLFRFFGEIFPDLKNTMSMSVGSIPLGTKLFYVSKEDPTNVRLFEWQHKLVEAIYQARILDTNEVSLLPPESSLAAYLEGSKENTLILYVGPHD